MSGNNFQTLLGVALMASFSLTGTSEPDLDKASRPALTEPTNESCESDTLSLEPCTRRKSQDPDNSWSLLDLKNYLKEQGGRLSGKKSELLKR